MPTYRFAAVIPAFNPGRIVTSVVSEAGKYVDRIFLIDDGSDGENKEYLEVCALSDKVTLITLPENRGKGFALIDGLREAIRHSADYVFTIDSDGQHNPEEIEKFKDYLRTSGSAPDLLLGTRTMIKRMPFRSKLGNTFTAFLFNIVFSRVIVDTQSGFRAFSRDFAGEIVESIPPGRYETEMKMLVHAVRSRRTVKEIEIDTIYIDGNKNSKFRPFQDSARVLSVFSKYTAIAITSFLVDYAIFLALTYLLHVYYLYAHAAARICSGTYNFFANKHLVFKSKGSAAPELIRYGATVAFSLLSSALLLYVLVDFAGISRAAAKPVAELTMFLVNFLILNNVVFAAKRD